ncbi:MAG: M13 family peptidase, partial [Bacteroidales bacterium]|nr:M13 family peptidase [Bacteroidales bacterium]
MSDKTQNLGSGFDFSNMDLSVSPGEDFYRYVNGKWLDNNPISPEMSRYAQFDKLYLDNLERQKQIIEDLKQNALDTKTDGGKIKTIYNQYMDSVSRNNAKDTPLKPYLDLVNNSKDLPSLMNVFTELQHFGISGLLFDFGISSDIKNASQTLVELWQGGLSLPSKSYYEN